MSKIINEFMGVYDKITHFSNHYCWSDSPEYFTSETSLEKIKENIDNYIPYSSDWNLLIKVVEKIESIVTPDDNSFVVTIITIEATDYCIIQDSEGGLYNKSTGCVTKIGATYEAVTLFLKWWDKRVKN